MECPILMVGRNDGDRLKILETVTSFGHIFSFASSLRKFAKLFEQSGTCIVFLDLELDGVNNAMIRGIKKNRPNTIIIGISAKAFHPELEDALRTHLFAVISKPIDSEELICCLQDGPEQVDT